MGEPRSPELGASRQRGLQGIARSRAVLFFFTLAGCGQGGHVGEAAVGLAAPRTSASPVAASAPASASQRPAVPASAGAVPPPAVSASAAGPASVPPAPAVLEVHTSAIHEKFSVAASGAVTMERSFGTIPDEVGHGQVPPARVEDLHNVLRDAGFCALAPKQRESSPGYITIEARFPDVACVVELPYNGWDKHPKAKKVIEAVRKLESEGCPRGCKP